MKKFFSEGLLFGGKKVLVNAGPTYEAIDPVRFIGNRSSGKTGVAIAEAFAAAGAEVRLVLGPAHFEPRLKGIQLSRVESAEEMYNETLRYFEESDIVICSAAVADYRPEKAADSKIKKKDAKLNLALVKTRDILGELGKRKTKQILAGFALETENLIDNAKEKLKNKNLDLIVANAANEAGSGFSGDTNRVVIINKHNKITNFELKSKQDIARDIVNYIADLSL